MLTVLGNGLLVSLGLLLAAPHDDNAVWVDLRDNGVALSSDFKEPLPKPTMADGLTEAEQQQRLTAVTGQGVELSRFLRQSPVSPYILQQRIIDNTDARGRAVDAYFIIYGKLDQLNDTELVNRVLNSEDDSDVANEGKQLDAALLQQRDIAWDDSRKDVEAYAHGAFTLWKRVEVASTLRTFWTRTPDSVLAAAVIDRRFDNDKDFPNQWRSLTQGPGGKVEEHDPQPYAGMGMYLKVTKLIEPEGALFVEWHLVFSEPKAWFDGKNLIGSKMPAIVQSRVRALRREFALDAANR